MEMRRHAKRLEVRHKRREGYHGTAAAAEHAILWLYWLISGYGLRAWRALTAFGAVIVVAAALFAYAGGFDQERPSATAVRTPTTAAGGGAVTILVLRDAPAPVGTSFWAAVSYSARTAVGLPRDPQPRLTPLGDVVQILVRILAPVLLGLAVLSIRGRVKR